VVHCTHYVMQQHASMWQVAARGGCLRTGVRKLSNRVPCVYVCGTAHGALAERMACAMLVRDA
jgi:hypothetical protein